MSASIFARFSHHHFRYINGDKLLISGKMQASEDFRLMGSTATIVTPDGDSYQSKDMWWGGNPTTPSGLDQKLVADINYAFDLTFEVKGKPIGLIAAMNFDMFNHTAQKKFKIALKNIRAPFPPDPNLLPGVTEIWKEVYLKWTSVEEAADAFRISFVVENKGSKDQVMQFASYRNASVLDSEGNSYEAVLTLKDDVTLPVDTPVAGNITVKKPLKLDQISLIEFSSKFFRYRIKNIVIP